MKIQTANSYRGLELNDTTKGFKGYYVQHLQTIYSLLAEAKLKLANPLVSHFVIDNPKDTAINSLNKELNRWKDQRLANSEAVSYFSCLETRPRNKQRHLHVMVIYAKPTEASKFLSTSLNLLTERLKKLSLTKSSKLCKRKSNARDLIIDQETGEIATAKEGLIIRLGSIYYHNLFTEFNDAFKRFSYLAKVHTKDAEQVKGANFSSSRIKGQHNTKETNASNTRIIDLLKQEISLSICNQKQDCSEQEHSSKSVAFCTSKTTGDNSGNSKRPNAFQGKAKSCSFRKSTSNSKNNQLFARSRAHNQQRSLTEGPRSPYKPTKNIRSNTPRQSTPAGLVSRLNNSLIATSQDVTARNLRRH